MERALFRSCKDLGTSLFSRLSYLTCWTFNVFICKLRKARIAAPTLLPPWWLWRSQAEAAANMEHSPPHTNSNSMYTRSGTRTPSSECDLHFVISESGHHSVKATWKLAWMFYWGRRSRRNQGLNTHLKWVKTETWGKWGRHPVGTSGWNRLKRMIKLVILLSS
jgi:hypothetical protein